MQLQHVKKRLRKKLQVQVQLCQISCETPLAAFEKQQSRNLLLPNKRNLSEIFLLHK